MRTKIGDLPKKHIADSFFFLLQSDLFDELAMSSNQTNIPSTVELTLKRIQHHRGVHGIIVVNPEGIPIRTDMDNSTTQTYASSCRQLVSIARSTVRDIDPLNDLSILRVRSKKYEIMVAPCDDYLLIVVQNDSE